MATMTVEAKRVKAGQSLTYFHTSAISAINQLKGIKLNLLNLKSSLESDGDFTAADVAEVNSKITDLATQVQSILTG